MASINDVANKAGVSKSTVSKVLNDYGSISEATKKRVNEAVEELNYYPNPTAVALSKQKQKKIALIQTTRVGNQTIDGLNMNYSIGATQTFNELGIEAMTFYSSTFKDFSARQFTTYFKKRGINGIIFFGFPDNNEVINEVINNEDFKVIVIDREIANNSTSSVSIDNYQAQQEIMKKAIADSNSNRILYIAGHDSGDAGSIRLQSVKDLSNTLDTEIDIVQANFNESEAYSIALEVGHKYDTIVCASDLMAVGALRAIKQHNHEAAVYGFDGINLLAYLDEKILTVKQDFMAIGSRAASEVVSLLDGKDGEIIFLDYEINFLNIDDVIV